jgi:hypothetical protein
MKTNWLAKEIGRGVGIAIGVAVAMLTACAHQALNMPQSGAVESGLSSIRSSVSTAQGQNKVIVTTSSSARSDLQRAHDKEVLEVKWKEWKAKQKPTPK